MNDGQHEFYRISKRPMFDSSDDDDDKECGDMVKDVKVNKVYNGNEHKETVKAKEMGKPMGMRLVLSFECCFARFCQ